MGRITAAKILYLHLGSDCLDTGSYAFLAMIWLIQFVLSATDFTVSDRLGAMLKPYFRFYWLALHEYVPQRRRKRLRVAYLVLAFIVDGIVADSFGAPLVKPLKWSYNLLPGSYWVIFVLLAVIIFKGYSIGGPRRVYEKRVWLQNVKDWFKIGESQASTTPKNTRDPVQVGRGIYRDESDKDHSLYEVIIPLVLSDDLEPVVVYRV